MRGEEITLTGVGPAAVGLSLKEVCLLEEGNLDC